MTMAAWERIEVRDVQWQTESGAGAHAFRLRVCPSCSAVVPDNDLAQQHHADWHDKTRYARNLVVGGSNG